MSTNDEPRLFLTALLLTFIILKLCSVISWSWWWVISPFWAPLMLWLLVVGVVYLFGRES